MNKSDSIKELAVALAKAQSEVENASKTSTNPHFKSKYADLAEIINTVRPVFSKHGLSVIQSPSFNDGVASVETLLVHVSGEYISGVSSCTVTKNDAQGVGSATTYLRRYSLAALACIAQEDDDANAAVGNKPYPKTADDLAEKMASEAEYKLLADKHTDSITVIKEALAINDLSTASEAWYELGQEVMQALWRAPSKGGCFTTQEREKMKTTEFRTANGGKA